MRKLLMMAAAGLILLGCSDDKFVGDESVREQMGNNLITIGTTDMTATRASLESLEGSMKVYGSKKVGDSFNKVFISYAVWNTATTTTEPGFWEYIAAKDTKKSVIANGTLGTENLTVPQMQIAKYWDYDASEYLFWAVSPYSTEVSFDVANDTVKSVVIKNVGAHLTAATSAGTYKKWYLADPVKKERSSNDYSSTVDGMDKPVTFSFERLGAKVRVGFYEVINGYKVTNIKFYCDADDSKSGKNICLNRTDNAFVGGAASASTSVTVNYNSANLSYTVASYSGLTSQKWVQFGKLDLSSSAPLATTATTASYGTDADMDANKYIMLLPTPVANVGSSAKPITIKMDITIQGEDADKEEIVIHGAQAVIPAQYASWKNNYAYSYIFKISDNITGSEHGLYPIVFDAEASSISDLSTGTTTTMGSTSITTYQDGSVVADGVTYQAGKDIVVYFMQGSTKIAPSSTNVQVLQMNANQVYDPAVTDNYTDITTNMTFDATNKKMTIGKTYVVSTQDIVIIYTDTDVTKCAKKEIDL